jgi:amino acid transporter
MSSPAADASPPGPLKLGTFIGVYTPTVLTILGVIMYLRLGWVVGNAGLLGAVLIIALANAITFVTALSMSTLATNMRVGVGGAYFLISRSFGLEVGGAIGIPLYLSQVLSVALYAYGLAEIATIVVDIPPLVLKIMACAIIVGVTVVAAKSTELTLKAQVPIMGLIALSIVAMVVGVQWHTSSVPLMGPWPEAGFWGVFAVFFPAVTGVLTGLSLSGDLEDPSKSIPSGVIGAVATGAAVYLALPFVLAYSAGPEALRSNSLLWTEVAVGGAFLVVPGMAGAVLSSAFGSILSAPRTLQALSGDSLAPQVLGEIDEETGEPLMGVRFSGALAFVVALLLPDLNAVASTVTVFFLTTYGALNGVAFLEALIGDPSFRPRIRVNWAVSLFGFLGCFLAMALINPLACAFAIVFEVGIFVFLSRRSLETTWGDARSGLLLTGARYALLRLRDARVDPRNWRPHILVLTDDVERDLPVLEIADHFGQHRGIVTLVHLVQGDLSTGDLSPDKLLAADRRLLERHERQAFAEIAIVPDPASAAPVIAQANGMAGLQSNTILFGYDTESGPERLGELIATGQQMALLGKSTLVYLPPVMRSQRPSHERTIAVWWAGKENNGDLMLLLAHLLTLSPEWSRARIQLKSIVDSESDSAARSRELEQLLPETRIDLTVHVIEKPPERPVQQVIIDHSREAEFVMLGMGYPADGDLIAYATRMQEMLEGLPATLLVRNAGEFQGRLV